MVLTSHIKNISAVAKPTYTAAPKIRASTASKIIPPPKIAIVATYGLEKSGFGSVLPTIHSAIPIAISTTAAQRGFPISGTFHSLNAATATSTAPAVNIVVMASLHVKLIVLSFYF
jgi:hypothetical protein